MNKNMINPVKLLKGEINQTNCFHPVVIYEEFDEDYRRGIHYSCAICDHNFNAYYSRTEEFCQDPFVITQNEWNSTGWWAKEFIILLCEKYIDTNEINIYELIKTLEKDIYEMSKTDFKNIVNRQRVSTLSKKHFIKNIISKI
jgi:hypothetical protein